MNIFPLCTNYTNCWFYQDFDLGWINQVSAKNEQDRSSEHHKARGVLWKQREAAQDRTLSPWAKQTLLASLASWAAEMRQAEAWVSTSLDCYGQLILLVGCSPGMHLSIHPASHPSPRSPRGHSSQPSLESNAPN